MKASRVFMLGAILGAVTVGLCPSAAFADFALSLDPGGGGGTPSADSNHGWRFTADEEIVLTDLGLYDHDDGGMSIDHPIGLFLLGTGELLTSGTISQGTGDPLIDHFRYVDVPNVALMANTDYVVAYYSASENDDFVITDSPVNLQFSPLINWVEGRWSTGGGGLAMPTNGTSAHRIGPNFQFVPEPASLSLLALGGLMLVARRRR